MKQADKEFLKAVLITWKEAVGISERQRKEWIFKLRTLSHNIPALYVLHFSLASMAAATWSAYWKQQDLGFSLQCANGSKAQGEKKKKSRSLSGAEAFVLSFMILEMATSLSDGSSKSQNALFFFQEKRAKKSNCIIFQGQLCNPWEF